MSIFKLALDHYRCFILLPKKDTKTSTIGKRVGQITPMCDPKTTMAYCCTKPNWIGSSRLWNNMPRLHSLGLLAYIEFYLRHGKNVKEDISAGRYFRVNSIFAKISKIHFSRKFPPAKIKCYTYSILYIRLYFDQFNIPKCLTGGKSFPRGRLL